MPFWRHGSLYFNLTSVAHTPLGQFKEANEARAFADSFEVELGLGFGFGSASDLNTTHPNLKKRD